MTNTATQKRTAFRKLHQEGCFILPNPWDAGSARMFEHLGFSAVASTSTGYAWTEGRPDYTLTKMDVLRHLGMLCKAVNVPVNADFESGFASDLEDLAENVTLAVLSGVAGLSIEDRDVNALENLYDKATAVERIRTARSAIDKTGEDVILVARTEGLLLDSSAINPAIDKLVAFADAGADCLYVPGVFKKEDIKAMVAAVSPKPVNVLVIGPDLTAAELADMGVRRISLGGANSQIAWNAVVESAKDIKNGSFRSVASAIAGSTLNDIFGRYV